MHCLLLSVLAPGLRIRGSGVEGRSVAGWAAIRESDDRFPCEQDQHPREAGSTICGTTLCGSLISSDGRGDRIKLFPEEARTREKSRPWIPFPALQIP